MFNLMLNAVVLFSEKNPFDKISNPIVDLVNQLFGPLMAVVGAVGLLYCVMLGVKYAKAEEPQEHEKAKNHLKNAIIGFVLIFVLMLALNVGIKAMNTWYDNAIKAANSTALMFTNLI